MERFKLPTKIYLNQRKSSIVNAFFNGIIPVKKPSKKEIEEHKKVLGMSNSEYKCIYCGNEATTQDHLNALVRDKKPTGYITELANLVPSCTGCNSSKGNKDWRTFIKYLYENDKLNNSKKSINSNQYMKALKKLEKFESFYKPKKLDLESEPFKKLFKIHIANLNKVLSLLDKSVETERLLAKKLQEEGL